MTRHIRESEQLRHIRSLRELIPFLRDELDWPIDSEDPEDITFDYDPKELGIEESTAVRIKEIKQLQPLTGGQPWGIFWVSFEKKSLPIVVLRRVLRALVIKKRAAHGERATWKSNDLLFLSAYGESEHRELAIAHFSEETIGSPAPTLRVLQWDGDDTALKLDDVLETLRHRLRWDEAFIKDHERWRNQWASAFQLRYRHAIRTSEELASALAEAAKRIRSRIRAVLRLEDGFGEMRKLQRAFQRSLIADLDDDAFADMFAQTVTYGLFSVSVRRTLPGEGTAVTKEDVGNLIYTSPFLKEMMETFMGVKTRKGNIDFDELGLSDVTDILTGPDTHMEVVLHDFNNKTRGEDPVIHFYERFLTAYNKQLKIQRGVFYTPQPVVSYIVRSVHELLQSEFGLEDGLADTTTWGEMIERSVGVPPAIADRSGQDARAPLLLPPLTDEPGQTKTISPDEPFVQILDPATGTATFLVEVIDVIHNHLEAKWKKSGAAAMPKFTERERSVGILPASNESGRNDHTPFLDPYSDVAIHEHHLPHWQQSEVFYFVTYRLADSLPAEKLREWQDEKDAWLRHHPEPWDVKTEAEYHQRFSRRMDEWLDAGHGACLLRESAHAKIVADAFLHFDGKRYDLDSFVVMPNHVHVLFRLRAGEVLEKVIHSWKSFTAKAVNKTAQERGRPARTGQVWQESQERGRPARTGQVWQESQERGRPARIGQVWQEDYWDRIVRNHPHLDAIRRYIAANPTAGGGGVLWQRRADVKGARASSSQLSSGQDARSPFATFAAYWNEYVPKALLPRLHAFELMMAPYAIAHMKIGLKLAETGYRFGTDERARIYLTNALEPWQKSPALPDFDALAHEAAAVNEIKRHKRFTVVIGNPPYAGISSNMTEYAQRIVDAYKFVDGGALNERKLWLQDDYVKFIRKAQTTIETTNVGVFGYITNHGFLDNPTFRGMRQSLMETFPRLCVLDLHGNANKKERSPDGSVDKPVFDIKQGVAICLATRGGGKPSVAHSEIWGTRESKYQWLVSHSASQTIFGTLAPDSPYYFFKPHGIESRAEYDEGWRIPDMFPLNTVGFVTARDALTIQDSEDEMWKVVERFVSLSEEGARTEFDLGKDARDWRVVTAQNDIRKSGPTKKLVQRILYRPFDFRFSYYTGNSRGFYASPCSNVMKHMIAGKNLALCFNRREELTVNYSHFLATRLITEHGLLSSKTTDSQAPLYLLAKDEDDAHLFAGTGSRPNLGSPFLAALAKKLNLRPSGDFGLPSGLMPEDIFHYAYAVFHSPGYRSRYAEFLKIDFPRLPLTGNLDLFRALARLGGELTALHLLEFERSAGVPPASFLNGGRDAHAPVEKISWSRDTVWIDKAQTIGFKGVREDVWDFHIGGYQVCAKWLKDRKGRTLTKDDIAHYQKIVIALSETIRLMSEIDEVIATHGGWPSAFATPTATSAKTA